MRHLAKVGNFILALLGILLLAVTDDYIIDPARVAALRGILLALPEVCDACFNRYHCARSCPDACPLDGLPPVDGFLCRVRRQLAEAEIDTLADRLCGELAATGDEWAARVLR